MEATEYTPGNKVAGGQYYIFFAIDDKLIKSSVNKDKDNHFVEKRCWNNS